MRFIPARSLILTRSIKKVRNLIKDPLPRKKVLVFEGYQLKLPKVEVTYRVGDKRYTSVVSLNLPSEELSSLDSVKHHPLFIHLGLSFAASHFLISDFSTVKCECASLSDAETVILEEQILELLTEFRYLNGLDPSRRVTVTSSGTRALQPVEFTPDGDKALLLNGGGKDSCVSAELLKKSGVEFEWLNAHPNAARNRVVESSGVSGAYSVDFKLSPDVLNDAAYPWGLIPYLDVITSASLIVAYLKGFKYIVTGAEHSADNPNLIFKGIAVNHQRGKTTAFENFTNAMCEHSILRGIKSFSIARPFTDLRLAEMFSHFPRYNKQFLSCNDGMGRDEWCNACHKCAFTFLALYPFVGRDASVEIFGEDLFEKPIIRKLILELTTPGVKPWECVGTREECQLALHYCLARSPDMEFSTAPFRAELEKACQGLLVKPAMQYNLETFHTPHNIPPAIEGKLRKAAAEMLESTVAKNPELFRSETQTSSGDPVTL